MDTTVRVSGMKKKFGNDDAKQIPDDEVVKYITSGVSYASCIRCYGLTYSVETEEG